MKGAAMTSAAAAIDRHQNVKASPIEIFKERCEARCLLIHNGLMDFQTAIDEMQEVAVAQGLVATHGQDAVQQIMSEAFGRWRF
jgi:predicted Rossmann fold nucleotide-binding protein DprA/Smf involved in DNA uptake